MTLCGTCGDSGVVCCGQFLDTGECCAALNGGAAMEPCPDCPGYLSDGFPRDRDAESGASS